MHCCCYDVIFFTEWILFKGQSFQTMLGIVSEKGMREEVPPVLQYQILQLALDLPASKFSWFRIQVNMFSCAIYCVI